MAGAWVVAVLLLLSGWAASGEETISKTFYSPLFELRPGDVTDSWFPIEFPKGHVAVRRFDAEVVDETGTPVLLSDLYLHHWIVVRTHVKKGHKPLSAEEFRSGSLRDRQSSAYLYDDAGLCFGNSVQWAGRGSETRKTVTVIRAPYGLVIGNPAEIPEGYEETWHLNVHGIDTRDAISTKNCVECLCESYNVTKDSNGKPLQQGYKGGLYCCYDKTHCAVKPDTREGLRKMFMKYSMDYVPFTKAVRPVRSYIVDVTDQRTSLAQKPSCKIEYDVEQCSKGSSNCVHTMTSVGAIDDGGDVIYMVAHQHVGGLGVDVVREDGSKICESRPIYGDGNSAGNEAGYVVGMTSCHPEIGTAYLKPMELFKTLSYYSTEEPHTGVMGLVYVYVADRIDAAEQAGSQESEGPIFWKAATAALAVFVAGVIVAMSLSQYMRTKRNIVGYEVLMNTETT